MQAWKMFCVFVFILILNKSFGLLSECNYFDTIDITNALLVENEYVYQDIFKPVNQTAEYDFKVLLNGSKVKVKPHRRACICNLEKCVRLCCPLNNILPNDECKDEVNESILSILIPQTNPREVVIVRDYPCEELPDRGQIYYKTDTFQIHFYKLKILNYEIEIFKHSLIVQPKLPPAVREIAVISLICYVLTIAVYLYVRKLQNLVGKCFIFSLLCMFMKCLIWVLNAWNLLDGVITLVGYLDYFFWMASFLWFFVLNHVFWDSFGSDQAKPHRFSFLTYFIFVWDNAAVLTVFCYVINYFWGTEIFHNTQYFIPTKMPAIIFYCYGTMLITGMINLIFSVQTGRILRKKMLVMNKGNVLHKFAIDVIWLRLFTILGVTWTLDLVLCIIQTLGIWPQVFWLADYFHAAFGIPVFVLLVLKESTLEWLKAESLDKNRQRRPSFQMAEDSC
ncbi:G-protein coupled receptor Mth [Drosophila eugracilis]|uniref:G-protein coupled receptor Mth n=1 Tax=Drosophila eugracilis TaxID=29029 RepID=UPI0007E7EC24|nr:G-protein coupled receptor Mth [Drosophila eugracilis]